MARTGPRGPGRRGKRHQVEYIHGLSKQVLDRYRKRAYAHHMPADDLSDQELAEVEAAWASEIRRRYESILDGTEAGLTDAEVRQRFGL